MTPRAPAVCAFRIFVLKLHVPLAMRAISPARLPLIAVHPLVGLVVTYVAVRAGTKLANWLIAAPKVPLLFTVTGILMKFGLVEAPIVMTLSSVPGDYVV